VVRLWVPREARAFARIRHPHVIRTFDVLLLGGRPIGEPVVQYGPFVMNTREEILQAVADYQAGRMGSIPATHFGAGPTDQN
jgi:redox-sensitive bicupin YhaK (pirin superfamily)